MQTPAIIGQPAPELQVEKWVQGGPVSLQQLSGQVVVIEVFQVNCPGCFVHALPEIVRLYETYKNRNVTFLGLATAFEDFDKNTEQNLMLLLEHGELTGDPLQQLGKAELLDDGRLDYALPFPIALDKHQMIEPDVSTENVRDFILGQLPDFDTMADDERAIIIQNARHYLATRSQLPLTFTTYNLQGTPSCIVVDQQGILRDVSFGWANHLEPLIERLLDEQPEK